MAGGLLTSRKGGGHALKARTLSKRCTLVISKTHLFSPTPIYPQSSHPVLNINLRQPKAPSRLLTGELGLKALSGRFREIWFFKNKNKTEKEHGRAGSRAGPSAFPQASFPPTPPQRRGTFPATNKPFRNGPGEMQGLEPRASLEDFSFFKKWGLFLFLKSLR